MPSLQSFTALNYKIQLKDYKAKEFTSIEDFLKSHLASAD